MWLRAGFPAPYPDTKLTYSLQYGTQLTDTLTSSSLSFSTSSATVKLPCCYKQDRQGFRIPDHIFRTAQFKKMRRNPSVWLSYVKGLLNVSLELCTWIYKLNVSVLWKIPNFFANTTSRERNDARVSGCVSKCGFGTDCFALT